MSHSLLICGFGYTAQYLVQRPELADFQIIATARKPTTTSINNLQFIPFNEDTIAHALSHASHVLLSIPPQMDGTDPVYTYHSLFKNRPNIQWMGYLSSTGVYGDHQGAWVDEKASSINLGPTATRRLNAEQKWYEFSQNQHLPFHIFRLAGIYGPGRNALERILQGKSYSIYKEGHFFSRIHVDDICTALIASMGHPLSGSIYNLADDEPAPAHEVEHFACQLLGRDPLSLIASDSAQLSSREKEFYEHNRRVENSYVKKALHICLRYPNYRRGLLERYHQLTSNMQK